MVNQLDPNYILSTFELHQPTLQENKGKSLPKLWGIELVILGVLPIPGQWVIVDCINRKCKNQGTYWSKKPPIEPRIYECPLHIKK